MEGITQYTAVQVPFLTEKQRLARLDFCKKWRDLTPDDWCAMFAFTDECQMQVGLPMHELVWRDAEDNPLSPFLLRPHFAKLSQCMVWGLISGKGKFFFY
jgi:hypothetical protein